VSCLLPLLLAASVLQLLMLGEVLLLPASAYDSQTLAVSAAVAGVAATAAAAVRREVSSPHNPLEDLPGLLGTAVACKQAHHATMAFAAFDAQNHPAAAAAAAALLQRHPASAALLLWLHI
jgi:hypothetical protein